MKNKWFRNFLIVASILVILIVARDIIIRISLEQYVRVTTGLKLGIGKLNTGLVDPTVTIKDLKLYNPSGYVDPVMADVGVIYFRYKRSELLKGRIHLKDLHFVLRELFIIRKSADQLNFDAFQSHGGTQPLPVSIDNFILKVGTIVYKNYIHRLKPEQKIYSLNLNEHYSGIQGTNDMENRIMESVLNKTSLASSIKDDLNRFRENVSGTILNGLQISNNSMKGLLNMAFSF